MQRDDYGVERTRVRPLAADDERPLGAAGFQRESEKPIEGRATRALAAGHAAGFEQRAEFATRASV